MEHRRPNSLGKAIHIGPIPVLSIVGMGDVIGHVWRGFFEQFAPILDGQVTIPLVGQGGEGVQAPAGRPHTGQLATFDILLHLFHQISPTLALERIEALEDGIRHHPAPLRHPAGLVDPTGMIVSRSGNRRHTLEGWRHGVVTGNQILRQPQIGLAGRPHPAVRPRQAGGPFDGIVAVGGFLKDGVVLSFGFKTAATVLGNKDIAILRIRGVEAVGIGGALFAIRSAAQQDGKTLVRVRPDHVGVQRDPIPGFHRDTLFSGDFVLFARLDDHGSLLDMRHTTSATRTIY